MRRRNRSPTEHLFAWSTIGVALAQGVSVLAACIVVFMLARQGHSPEAARGLTFATLVVAFLAVILVNRSWARSAFSMLQVRNVALRWVLLGTTSLLAVVLLVPGAQRLLHFAPLHPTDLALALGAGAVCVAWFELLKGVRRRARYRH